MVILLTHGYFINADAQEKRIMKPYVPLGILHIAAYLEERGISVSVFDSTFSSLENFSEELSKIKPTVVGIYINMMTKFNALKMIRIAKASNATVIIGGPEPTFYAPEYIAAGADLIVVGEGEITILEVLNELQNPTPDFSRVDGLIYQDARGKIHRTAQRAFISDLDTLPLPARKKVRLQDYTKFWKQRHGYSSLSLITMRGCPFTCKWCSHAVYGESYRRRSPKLVVDEIELLVHEYHPNRLWFADDVFTINHKWFFDFSQQVCDRKLSIQYDCITRADRLNEQVIASLARTGCTTLWIGGESGSQNILDAMARDVRVEQIQAMTALAQTHGIEVGMFVMFGYPGETANDVELTIEHVRKSKPDFLLTTTAYPIKGTRFYDEAASLFQEPTLPFEEWNDRMIALRREKSNRFYWFAHRRIVNESLAVKHASGKHKHIGKFMLSKAKATIARLGMIGSSGI